MDTAAVQLDNTIITIQTDGMDGGGGKAASSKALLGKIRELLQDRRESNEEGQIKRHLSSDPNSSDVLKRILNILFLTTGGVLLAGVVAVIIYTSVSSPPTFHRAVTENQPHNQNSQISQPDEVDPLVPLEERPAQNYSESTPPHSDTYDYDSLIRTHDTKSRLQNFKTYRYEDYIEYDEHFT